MTTKKIVITGGPSTGKTSVIEKIEERGYPCFPEISRNITLEAREQGIPQLFLSDPLLFSKRILEGRLDQFREAAKSDTTFVFLDRGLPDVTAYLDCFGQKYEAYFDAVCLANRYDMVFLLPPWKEIHQSDNERHENFGEALRIHDFLELTYQRYGYEVRDVPIGTVAERVDFIFAQLNIK